MENIIKWSPIVDTPSKVQLDNINYDNDGLKIILRDTQVSNRVFKLHFKVFLGFRSFAEFYRIRMASENPDPNWMLFLSEEDDLLKWVDEENYHTIDSSRKLINYVIWTEDDIVEIVSDHAPIVEWLL